MAQSISIK